MAAPPSCLPAPAPPCEGGEESEFLIGSILVRIHFICEMIWWTGLAPWEFEFLLTGSLISTFLEGWGVHVRGGTRSSVRNRALAGPVFRQCALKSPEV